MAKSISEERMAIVIVMSRQRDPDTQELGEVEVKCHAEYKVSSDGVTESCPRDIELTPQQEAVIKSFGANVLQSIKDKEGIS